MARRGNSRKPKGGPGNHGRGDLHDAGEASNPLPAFNTLEINSPPVSGRPRANDEQEKKKPQDLQQEYWDHFVKSAGAVTKKPPQSQPEVNIIANFLKSKVNIPSIHEYSLQFYQNKKSKRVEINKRSELPSAFEAFKKSEEINVLGNTKYFTDFSTLWCISPLANIVDGKMTTKPFSWSPPGKREVDNLQLAIHGPQILKVGDVFSQKTGCDLAKEIRALNAIITNEIRGRSEEFIQVGPNKFFVKNENAREEFGGRLLALRGYETSFRPSKVGLLLNIHTCTGTFLPNIRVSELLDQYKRIFGPAKQEAETYVGKLLQGCRVRIMYDRENFTKPGKKNNDPNTEHNRTKVFKGFGRTLREQKFFKTKYDEDSKEWQSDLTDTTGTTVLDYFKEKLAQKVTDKDSNILCVNVGNSKSIPSTNSEDVMRQQSVHGYQWIPANQLLIMADQPTFAKLSPSDTQAFQNIAVRRPEQNALFIESEGLGKLGLRDDATLEKLQDTGIKTERQLIQFPAQILPAPTVNGKEKLDIMGSDIHMGKGKFKVAKKVSRIAIMGLLNLDGKSPNLDEEFRVKYCKKFGDGIVGRLQSLGMEVRGWKYSSIDDLDNLSEELCNKTDKGDCAVFVLPDTTSKTYGLIKRASDMDQGRHCLCVTLAKVKKTSDKLLTNLAMKINIKMEGVNYQPEIKELPKNTIVLGADVTHPGKDSAYGTPSIACVVGSVDSTFMNYPGSMRLQAFRKEIISDLEGMVKERLLAWYTKNRTMPENMVFYRDGVSESQFKECIEKEIPAINQAYKQARQQTKTMSKPFKLTFVIVTKRHSSRFFPTKKRDCTGIDARDPMKSNLNVRPGLYVGDTVTDPGPTAKGSETFTNFYLQPHEALKGTARSAHYYVLKDDMRIGNSMRLPNITHALSYAFGRSTRAVSYVAPTYIADRLCERGRVYLRGCTINVYEDIKKESEAVREDKLKDAAKTIAESKEWGCNANKRNPWHTDLKDTMFWM